MIPMMLGQSYKVQTGLRKADTSVLVVVGVFAAVVALLLYVSFTGLEILSWSRSYVAGEGLWSRGQKDATIALQRYARTGNESDYGAYQTAMQVPRSNRRARELLKQPDPDMAAVHEAFAQAGNHPDDIAGFTAALRAFKHFKYIERALQIWEHGDALIERIEANAQRIRAEILSDRPDPEVIAATLDDIDTLNQLLTAMERQFSVTLGEGARWLKHVIMAFLLVTTILLVSAAVVWSSILARQMRRTQDALCRSEEDYRTLVKGAAYGMYRSSEDGRFLAVNPALVDMLGYRSEEDVLALSLANDLYRYPAERARLVSRYREVDHIENVEVDWRRQDGTPITVRLSGRPYADSRGRGFEMIVEDVTERKILEEQLRQSQKMEAVGQLTGGIAHDLNNLLTVILANADLLAASSHPLHGSAEAEAELNELREAARRGAAMIRKLLAFSRRERLVREPIDLGAVVRETAEVLRRLLPENIEIQVSTGQPLPAVEADAGSIEQILVNVATNSRDAMPRGGTLRIDVKRGRIDERHVARHGWGQIGEYVCVHVSDTGTGMDAETRRRLFEPFFTTKAPGSGTGLGAAMIYGLVKQHEGYVDVTSQLGSGTTVVLFLPARRVPAVRSSRLPRSTPIRGGDETVLVVEDEPAVREAVRRGLGKLGYRVLLASDGAEGIAVFRQHAESIDLVLTDVVMPKVTGPQLREVLRKEHPNLKVLFMSGYILRGKGDIGEFDPTLPLLRKPWTLAELAEKIRELLDAPAKVAASA